jgi:hypothetical protein
LVAESHQFAKFYSDQLEAHHEQALTSLQTNYEAQVDSYNTLSGRMSELQDTAYKTKSAANASFNTIISIEQQLVNLSDQADHIAQGFAFFSAIPLLLSSLFRSAVATVGIVFLFSVLCKINKQFATYAAGACSSAYLFHLCGLYQWLGNLSTQAATNQEHSWVSIVTNLSSSQKAASLVMILWLGAYPVGYINVYLGTVIGAGISKIFGSYWLRQYHNEGGFGLLPSIEIPTATSSDKADGFDNGFLNMHPLAYYQRSSTPVEA